MILKEDLIVIPDIHCRKFWENVIPNKRIIFLGDYVDPYAEENLYSPIESLEKVIEFKKNNPELVTLLLGNHDMHYIWNNFPKWSRYNGWFARDLYGLYSSNLSLFSIAYAVDDLVITHAGITKAWCSNISEILNCSFSIKEVGKELQKLPLSRNLDMRIISALGMISTFRGGEFNTGSCVGADIREHYHATPTGWEPREYDCYQIFGHTQLKHDPIITNNWACLDCRKPFIVNDKIIEYSL